jgi:hypothetical protein
MLRLLLFWRKGWLIRPFYWNALLPCWKSNHAEAQAAIRRISGALPDERLRSRFIAAASAKMPAEVAVPLIGTHKTNTRSVNGAPLGT